MMLSVLSTFSVLTAPPVVAFDDLPTRLPGLQRVMQAIGNTLRPSDPDEWQYNLTIEHSDGAVSARYDGTRSRRERVFLRAPIFAVSGQLHDIWNSVQQNWIDDGRLFVHDLEFEPGSIRLRGEVDGLVVYDFTPQDPAQRLGDVAGQLRLERDADVLSGYSLDVPVGVRLEHALTLERLHLDITLSEIEGLDAPVMTRIDHVLHLESEGEAFETRYTIKLSDIEYLGE